MKELLESKDLLAEPRVVDAAKGLGVELILFVHATYCHRSLADVAEEMRDEAMEYLTEDILYRVSGVLCKTKYYVHWWWFQFATAQHDIVAAVLAWETKS